MSNKRTKEERIEYEGCIAVLKRVGDYHLMRRFPETGIWYVVGSKVPYRGLVAAQEALEQYKKSGYDGRPSDLKVEPEALERVYRQVWNEVFRLWIKMGLEAPPDPPWRYNLK